jgi:hypothetical protein
MGGRFFERLGFFFGSQSAGKRQIHGEKRPANAQNSERNLGAIYCLVMERVVTFSGATKACSKLSNDSACIMEVKVIHTLAMNKWFFISRSPDSPYNEEFDAKNLQ